MKQKRISLVIFLSLMLAAASPIFVSQNAAAYSAGYFTKKTIITGYGDQVLPNSYYVGAPLNKYISIPASGANGAYSISTF